MVARTFAVRDHIEWQTRPGVLADLLAPAQRAASEEAEATVGRRDEAKVLEPKRGGGERGGTASRQLDVHRIRWRAP